MDAAFSVAVATAMDAIVAAVFAVVVESALS